MHILPIEPSLVPVSDVFKCLFKRPTGHPMQALLGFGDVELEVVGLVRVIANIFYPAGVVAPTVDHLINNPMHRAGIFVLGAEVPAFCKGLTLGVELFG